MYSTDNAFCCYINALPEPSLAITGDTFRYLGNAIFYIDGKGYKLEPRRICGLFYQHTSGNYGLTGVHIGSGRANHSLQNARIRLSIISSLMLSYV